MNKYEDIFESQIKLHEAKDKNVLATLEFSWGEGDRENKNKRTYPFEKVFRPAVEALADKVKASRVAGMVDHPLGGGGTRLSSVSHVLDKIWLEGKKAYARAQILPTSKGADLMSVLRSGCKIGASLRGYGEVDNTGRVKQGLEISSVDLVANPSFGKDAEIGVHNIVIESTILEQESSGPGELSLDEKRIAGVFGARRRTVGSTLKEKRTKRDMKLFEEYLEAGGRGTFEDWKNKFGGKRE